MNRLLLFIFTLSINFSLFAQRGHIRPEDYEDVEDLSYQTSSSGDNPVFWLVVLILIIIVVVWFSISLRVSKEKEIKQKTVFLTKYETDGHTYVFTLIQKLKHSKKESPYFEEMDGVVKIPAFSKCIILEYAKESNSYVKVQFEKFPKPLYVPRWYLRTPDRINE